MNYIAWLAERRNFGYPDAVEHAKKLSTRGG